MRKLLFFACFFLFLTVILPAHSAKMYAQPQDSIDSPVQLKMLSWNIFMLPEFITFTNKVERAIEIGEMLRTSDYDVIVLQEAFMKKARVIIYEMIKDSFPYIIEPANNEGFSFKSNSGVWILSKIKLNVLGTTRFKFCKVADCMARKGAMMVEGEKQGKKFHLIGTHLQAENYPYIRKRQFKQIQEELISRFSQKNVPLIIGGDLNTEKMDTLNYKDMLTSLDAEDGDLDGDVQATWGGMNYKFDKKDKNPILDYILLRKNGKKVKVARRKVNIFRSKKADYNLSDHFGVEMEMVF